MSVKDDGGPAFPHVVRHLIAIICMALTFMPSAKAQSSSGIAGAAAAIGFAVQAVVNSLEDDDGDDD
jgi:hypothetical protein